jgi:hypothetical protein
MNYIDTTIVHLNPIKILIYIVANTMRGATPYAYKN